MNRRELLRFFGLTALGLAVAPPSPLQAGIRCTPFNERMIQQCEVGIDSAILNVTAAAVGGQHLSQWCWAACIEMVFRYHGFAISQEEIVRQTWGAIVNLPADPYVILANLNRPWIDRQGRHFQAVGDVFTANWVTAAQDLADDRPLIIGTLGHAMLLTALNYFRDAWGRGNIISAVVRDPWQGRGRRILTAPEWYNTNFLVRIRLMQIM